MCNSNSCEIAHNVCNYKSNEKKLFVTDNDYLYIELALLKIIKS